MIKASIIIPAYNQAGYLSHTINSVLSQDFDDFECIIVDDGSTDNTKEICNNFGLNQKIKYHYQSNRGLAGARNTGISFSKGKYLHFLDSDDLIAPDFLSRMISVLDLDESIDILSCGWILIDRQGNKLSKKIGPAESSDYFKDLILGNLFPVHSAVTRRSLFKKIGLFNQELRALEDWELWLRAAGNGLRFSTLDFTGVLYRKHPKSMTLNIDMMLKNLDRFIRSVEQKVDGFAEYKDKTRIYQLLRIAIYSEEAGDQSNLNDIVSKCESMINRQSYDHEYMSKLYEIIRTINDKNARKRLILSLVASAPDRYKKYWNKKSFINMFRFLKKEGR